GGCVANFEHFGYQFEPTYGLYSGWETGGIYDRIFSELPVEPPHITEQSTAYTVRLPDGINVSRTSNVAEFHENLRLAFPECAEAAIHFYRGLQEAAARESQA